MYFYFTYITTIKEVGKYWPSSFNSLKVVATNIMITRLDRGHSSGEIMAFSFQLL